MHSIGYLSAILTGYGAISFGILKMFWIKYGVHFYFDGVTHVHEAPLHVDVIMIALLIICGLMLVTVRHIIPSALTVLVVCMYEFMFLHHAEHTVVQIGLYVAIASGQIATLFINVCCALEERANASKFIS